MSSPQSRIAELSTIIAQHTQKLDNYLAANNLPYPSFDADGPIDLGLPPEIEQSRTAILQASQELNDLLQGPRDLLFNHQHNNLIYLKLISHFSLAHKVPAQPNSSIPFTDLASSLNIDASALTRILRLGIANRVFSEPRPGVLAHSAASRLIKEDPRVEAWVGSNVDDMWPAAQRVVDALQQWPQAAEPNQTGFALANQTSKDFYAVLAEQPERAKRFGLAMSSFTTGPGYSLSHLINGFPWDSILDGGTVIDIGGSTGDAAFALASAYPHLHFVVQELPEVVANAKEREGGDVKFMIHDMFEEQPVEGKGADVYLLRWVLHNWPDAKCVAILRALIPALKRGARVLVMDFVMPPFGVLPNDLERKLRAMDLTMLEIANAKERDLGEWKMLFGEVDERLVFKGVKQPAGSRLSVLEWAWEE